MISNREKRRRYADVKARTATCEAQARVTEDARQRYALASEPARKALVERWQAMDRVNGHVAAIREANRAIKTASNILSRCKKEASVRKWTGLLTVACETAAEIIPARTVALKGARVREEECTTVWLFRRMIVRAGFKGYTGESFRSARGSQATKEPRVSVVRWTSGKITRATSRMPRHSWGEVLGHGK